MATQQQLLLQVQKIIPPLAAKAHKGQAGRVGILGGSKDYAGAPFYAGFSAMRLGADLGHVICDPSAGAVIKTYSPDLIVHPFIHPTASKQTIKSELSALLPRLHVLVLGPGLGRDEYMQSAAKIALDLCKEKGLFVVLDADALFLVGNEPEIVKGYKRAVLTPNVVEFKRLCDNMRVQEDAKELSNSLGGVTVLQKGSTDVITNGAEVVKGEQEGGLKRCGGQGDVLSGCLGTFLAWAKAYLDSNPSPEEKIQEDRIPILAAFGASTVTRYSSKITFEKKKRAMQTSDMLEAIGDSYEHFFGSANGKL